MCSECDFEEFALADVMPDYVTLDVADVLDVDVDQCDWFG